MKKFKDYWEIQENWQLLFPLMGIIGLGYSSFKLAYVCFEAYGITSVLLTTFLLFIVLLTVILRLFKWLSKRWILEYKWEMIRVFIVFAITGSASMFVGRPIMKYIGINKDNLGPFFYWVLFVLISLIFYQILLVSIGWLFGQFNFFWEFEKKMLRRFRIIKKEN